METLRTERLILREWKDSDSPDLFEYGKSDLVGPNAGWPQHKDEEESKAIIKRFIAEQENYAIVLESENKVIGGIGMHKRTPDPDLAHLNQREIGYVLNPAYWGQGIVPEAVRYLITYGFEDLNLDVIWCAHFDWNEKSRRVVEKCGFQYQFSKNETLKLLDNKEVVTLYYNVYKES